MEENPHSGPGPDDLASPSQRKKSFVARALTVVIVVGLGGVLIALLMPAQGPYGGPPRRAICKDNMMHIRGALLYYAKVHGALPPAYTTDANGKPLHSWRTLILPYLEEQRLYNLLDLTKPWDDPVNAEVFKLNRVSVYESPWATSSDHRTTYLAVVTPSSCLRPAEPRPLSDVTDGLEQTIVVIEVDVDHAVPWMSPVDADEELVLSIGPKSQMDHSGDVWPAMFLDGMVRMLSVDMAAAERLALISIAGGDNSEITLNVSSIEKAAPPELSTQYAADFERRQPIEHFEAERPDRVLDDMLLAPRR
jgi:Protein of unknown function (DUF1559)